MFNFDLLKIKCLKYAYSSTEKETVFHFSGHCKTNIENEDNKRTIDTHTALGGRETESKNGRDKDTDTQ